MKLLNIPGMALAAALLVDGGLSWGALAGDGPGVTPVRLNCEYLANPVGVDQEKPRLAWQIGGEDTTVRHGIRQTGQGIDQTLTGRRAPTRAQVIAGHGKKTVRAGGPGITAGGDVVKGR